MSRAIDDYSMLDPDVSSDPYEFYSRLHQECPVYQMPENGAFVVTRYSDLRQVLRDYETYTSDVRVATMGSHADLQQNMLREHGWEHVQTLQRTDPPVHGRYRKLLDRVFTIKRVREMTPYMEAVTNDLIDRFIHTGSCDFNADFSMPMPGIIIAEQLGLSREEVGTFKKLKI